MFRFIEEELAIGHTRTVRDLLDDDPALWEAVREHLEKGQTAVKAMITALEHLQTICSHIPNKSDVQPSELYVKAMSGELAGSTTIRDALLSVKKAPSDSLDKLLSQISSLPRTDLSSLHHQLHALLQTPSNNGKPLRSEHDTRHQTLRTTIVAQKVELSKQKSTLSKDDAAYSQILNRVHDVLQSYFSDTLIDPRSLFLHEIFIYDLKSPHRDVFAAKPRFAVERALSAPHDYLACACCEVGGDGLSSTQPPTAVLYQLYLESGALINLHDLWSAFYAVVVREDGDGDGDEESEERKALYVFSWPLPLRTLLLRFVTQALN